MTARHALFSLLVLDVAHAQAEQPDIQAVVAEQADARAPDADAGAEQTVAAAQVRLEEPKPNQGHFLAVGAYSVAAMAFDESRGMRQPSVGAGFGLRVGESLTDWLNLSLALGFASTGGEPQDSLSLVRFGITSQWYFTRRWFVQAGLGAANVQGPDPEDHDVSRGRYGDVYLVGLGHDFYLSDSRRSGGWVLTPVVTAEVSPASKFTSTSLWLGVEISWWGGLARDKLNLPASEAYER